jgi:hypothetical protein
LAKVIVKWHDFNQFCKFLHSPLLVPMDLLPIYAKLAETQASDTTHREGALLTIEPTENGVNIQSVKN